MALTPPPLTTWRPGIERLHVLTEYDDSLHIEQYQIADQSSEPFGVFCSSFCQACDGICLLRRKSYQPADMCVGAEFGPVIHRRIDGVLDVNFAGFDALQPAGVLAAYVFFGGTICKAFSVRRTMWGITMCHSFISTGFVSCTGAAQLEASESLRTSQGRLSHQNLQKCCRMSLACAILLFSCGP